jgi:hypothetical protein
MNQKIINHDTFNFSDSVVIKPQEQGADSNKKLDVRYTRVVVDSRDRNTNLYPTPSSYSINLEETIEDIFIGELLVANIPFSQNLINKNNNCIKIKVNSVEIIVLLKSKNYTETELATEIQTTLNNNPASLINGYSFSVLFDADTLKYSFACNYPFQVIASDRIETDYNGNDENKYTKNSAFKILGFGKEVYTSVNESSVYRIDAPFSRNFTDSNYIVIYIDEFSINKSISSNLNKSFAVVQDRYISLSYFSATNFIKKFFPQPIAKLSKITIKMYDVDGNLYDFDNKDHRLEIMLHSYKHVRGYNSYIVGA